ncbi:hypothetical protein KI387_037684, partial [Taxus chinensis]
VEGRIVSEIGPGLLVFVGLLETDVESDAHYICKKVLNMRLFPNEKTGEAWDQSVMQRNYEVLLVSQFTLYGILKGNKPDFHVAMPPLKAKPFYTSLVEKFSTAYNANAVKGSSTKSRRDKGASEHITVDKFETINKSPLFDSASHTNCGLIPT